MFNVRGPIAFEAWQLKEKHIHTCIKKDVCSLSFKTRVKNLKFNNNLSFFLLICGVFSDREIGF